MNLLADATLDELIAEEQTLMYKLIKAQGKVRDGIQEVSRIRSGLVEVEAKKRELKWEHLVAHR